MDDIKLICHSCNAVTIGVDECKSCGIDFNNIRLLCEISIDIYNRSINLIDSNNIKKAWAIVSDQITVFPYMINMLELGYLLSLDNGDYQETIKIINQLRIVLPEDNYQLRLENIKKNIEFYNYVIENEFDPDLLDRKDLSYYHREIINNKNSIIVNSQKNESFIAKFLSNSYAKYLSVSLIMLSGFLLTMLILLVKENSSLKDKYQMELNLQESKASALLISNEFYNKLLRSMNEGNYVESVSILKRNQGFENFNKDIEYILRDLCEKLWMMGEYDLLLDIDYDYKNKPEAFYRLFLKKKNDNRIEKGEEFIRLFPNYENYTSPILLEIIKHYESINNDEKAYHYSVLLEKHIEKYPNNYIFLNSNVESILNERKKVW